MLLPIQLRKPGPGFHDRPFLPQKKQAEIYRKGYSRQVVALPAFEPSPGEEEADGFLVYRVPGLHKEILSLNKRGGWGASRDKDKEKDKDRQTDSHSHRERRDRDSQSLFSTCRHMNKYFCLFVFCFSRQGFSLCSPACPGPTL